MRSTLYAVNTNSQTVAVGGSINFGTAVRQYGCGCTISSGVPNLNAAGFFSINTNINLTASAGGTATVTLYQDGVAIPGATASATVASGDILNISIPAIVRSKCCCGGTISAILTGVAATVTNAAIIIEKE